MSVDLTPPAPTEPTGRRPESGPKRSSATVVATVAIAAGGVLLLGTLLSGIGSLAWAAGGSAEAGPRTADAAGITALSLNVSAGHVVIEYADVDEAILSATDDDREWRLEREGDTLSLRNDRPWWAFQTGFDWTTSRATLTLPEALADETLDATFDVSAGSVTAEGTYGTLQVQVGAGDADVSGTADELAVDVSAGSADVAVDGARRATLEIGAGEIVASLTGDALAEVSIDVSAGSLVADLPDAEWDVTSDVSAGSFDNFLTTSTGATRTVDVQVSAGGVTLRPGD